MSSEFGSDKQVSGPFGPSDASAVRQTVRVLRTYLVLSSFGHLRRGAAPTAAARLSRLQGAPERMVAEWRRLYAEIGNPFHWHDRDAWSDRELAQHLARSAVRVFRVQALLPTGARANGGFLELELLPDQRVEIVYLGLVADATGFGLGRWLVAEAVDEAKRMNGAGVCLNTCTLDGPAALPNYLARGFVVTKTDEYDATIAVHDTP